MLEKIKYFLRNIQFYIFLLVSLTLPLTKEYLPYVTFLWVLSGIITIRNIDKEYYKDQILLIFPFLFYLAHIIGVIYSSDFKSGLFDLEVKLSILFIPLIAIFITEKVRINYRLVLKLFVFGNFLASIICLFLALNNSIQINDIGSFFFEISVWPEGLKDFTNFQLVNQRFSYFSYAYLSVIHHPSYFSVYIIFSVAVLVYLIRSSKKRHILYYSLIVYFTVFIWLLGSRAGYITYLICFISFFFIVILKYKKYWIGVGVLIVGLILTMLILSNSQINKNIKESINIIENNESLTKDSDIRLWLWKSGIEVFKDNFLFGVGTGDIDEFLDNKYREYNLENAYLHNYNTHNQYLDVAIKLGIIGLLILSAWVISILVIAIKRKYFLFFYFGLIIFINFFFEAMLNSIAGVSFFVFFYSLLYSNMNQKKKELT